MMVSASITKEGRKAFVLNESFPPPKCVRSDDVIPGSTQRTKFQIPSKKMRFLLSLYFNIPDSTLNAHLTAPAVIRFTHHSEKPGGRRATPDDHHREYAPDFDCSFNSNLNEVITATMMSRVLLFLALVVLSAQVCMPLCCYIGIC
jgi:hypothetical protein